MPETTNPLAAFQSPTGSSSNRFISWNSSSLASKAKTKPPARLIPTKGGPAVPVLRVNLLGGLEVRFGDVPYDHSYLHRQKVKALLAFLILSEGREMNTDYLQGMLWPSSAPEKNRNNFNNLWSLLRKALTRDAATGCPYLSRHQGVCKIDPVLVDSDVAELRALCDAFQFGDVSPAEALELYRRLQRVYRGDLLPGEKENLVVLHDRRLLRKRTVDALCRVTALMVARGAWREAAWFAQAGLTLDPSREDLLRLEMRLLIDQGNPSQAIGSYARTRRALKRGFGTEPCGETAGLLEEALRQRGGDASMVTLIDVMDEGERGQGAAVLALPDPTSADPFKATQRSRSGTIADWTGRPRRRGMGKGLSSSGA